MIEWIINIYDDFKILIQSRNRPLIDKEGYEMKKNLMSVIILALVAVNVVLTGIIMFSTVSANRKTIALVDDIAAILNLELESGSNGEEAAEEAVVLPENSEVYDIADSMTVALKASLRQR